MHLFLPLAIIAVEAFVFLVLFGPIISWFTITIPKSYDYRVTRDDDLSTAAKEFFLPAIQALRDEGFEVVANLKPANAGIAVRVIIVAFVRRETGDMATVARASNVVGQSNYVIGFDTQFEDGTSVVTVNQSGPGIFPVAPYERKLAIPSVRDLRTLYQIHKGRVLALGPVGVSVDAPAAGTELDRLHRDHSRTTEWLIAAGYLRPTTRSRHRTTLKGAAIMTWRLIIPIKWIIVWRQRRQARAELGAIGFNAFSPVVAASQS